MRRALALSRRIPVTGILAFWAGPAAFLAWFVLPALLWPFSVAEWRAVASPGPIA